MNKSALRGLATLLFGVLACNPSGEAPHHEVSPAASAAPAAPVVSATPAAPAAPAAVAQVTAVEARVPREAATKLIELCESPRPEAASEKPSGEHAVPEMEGPKVVAARLFGLRPDSLLGKAGFLNGDRVADISGVAPGAPKDRWDSIRKSDRLDVRVVRRGALMKLTLIVE